MESNLIDREHQSIYQTYKRLPIVIDRAEGARIYDIDGNSYLDFLAGIAVNALGHSHPSIIAAVEAQIKKYMHVSNYFYQEPQVRLAEKIKEKSGFSKVFFSNSGTEAMEGVIKLVRRWGFRHDKTDMIAFTGGFHGRTYGALSLMDKPLYKSDMGPFLSGMKVIEYNNTEALRAEVNRKTAALVLEFVQGEGGVVSADSQFVSAIKELRDKYNFLLVADEVQAGTGRTGKFFAFQHYDIKPDIIFMAKGIGGGLPLGAIVVSEELSGVFERGMHGTTYGGNPVACAAGLAVIDELDKGIMENAGKIGEYLYWALEDLRLKYPSKILEVRGKGLMRGLHLSFDAALLVDELLKRRIIANAASGTTLRLVPPLIIGKQEVDELLTALSESLKVI